MLSTRERDVEIGRDRSNAEIAAVLFLSEATVKAVRVRVGHDLRAVPGSEWRDGRHALGVSEMPLR